LARLLPGPVIEILGRKDSQIKLHGLRIEVDEIVSKIISDDAVLNATVLLVKSADDSDTHTSFLCAVLVPNTQNTQNSSSVLEPTFEIRTIISRIKNAISENLPYYMLPKSWLPVNTIPVNSSGKTDSKKLHEILSSVSAENLLQYLQDPIVRTHEKLSEKENLVCSTLSDLLNIEKSLIGRNTSFFNAGGDSVTAILFAARCRKMGFEISVGQIMKHPLISSIAENLNPIETSTTNFNGVVLPFSLLKYMDYSIDSVLNALDQLYKIPKELIEDCYPVSALQEGMLTLSLMSPALYKLHQ
jgi:aryl carrier-like protein